MSSQAWMVWPRISQFRSWSWRCSPWPSCTRRARRCMACSARSATQWAARSAWAPAGCSRPRPRCRPATRRCCSPTASTKSGSAWSASSSASGSSCSASCRATRRCNRKLLDEITRIEEDYKKCGEVPPPPPGVDRGGRRGRQRQDRRQRARAAGARGDQALDHLHPRQDARRLPPRLRAAPQDPRELHAVLALGGQEPGPGRAEHGAACRRTCAPSTPTWRSTSRSTKAPTRRSTR